ncbi:MAG: YkgJ family cysteine cluster protein, partial [Deltaproteobacteria bacterium]|nr:YkgJ family cysteine cluster protein [Deltaproteobacteria bacterium]
MERRSHVAGPLERALRELWQSARHRLWQPQYWGRHLQLRRRYDLRPLRLARLRLRVPPGLVPDCDACEEVCCTGRTRVVTLRLLDVARLVDVGLESHISRERPQFTVAELDGNPALRDRVASDLWRWSPVLTQDRTATCTLLDANLGCRAYPAWPLSCARFPYSVNFAAGTIFYAPSCRSTRIAQRDEAPAPARALVVAAVDCYNEQIRDLVLLHVARAELEQLGLLRFL